MPGEARLIDPHQCMLNTIGYSTLGGSFNAGDQSFIAPTGGGCPVLERSQFERRDKMPYSSVQEQFPSGASYIVSVSNMNASGEIAGSAYFPNGNFEAVIWSPTGAPTVLQGGSEVQVYAINNNGEAVGYDDGEGVLWTSETSPPRTFRRIQYCFRSIRRPIKSLTIHPERISNCGATSGHLCRTIPRSGSQCFVAPRYSLKRI